MFHPASSLLYPQGGRVRRVMPWLLAFAVLLPTLPGFAQARPRLFVTTDIGGDPDDQQSLIRLLAHADAFRIEGLVASSRGTPGELEGPEPQPQLITERINAYAQHHQNLLLHSPTFPDPADLLSKVHVGNAMRGVSAVGVGNDTAGSNALIAAVDASTEPLIVSIWGGATELAQALTDVQATRTPQEVGAFVDKLRVFAINDQDGYSDAAEGTLTWVKANFPQLSIIDPTPAGAAPDNDVQRFHSTYRGFYQNDSATFDAAPPVPLVSDPVAALTDQAWAETNIVNDHGALGALYPADVVQNPQTARNTTGVKEGDTPAWIHYFPTGFGDASDPTLGGWGGRYQPVPGTNHFAPAFDELPEDTPVPNGANEAAAKAKWTVARHREAYQNELAARMDWFVNDFANANHAPQPFFGLSGPKTFQTDPGDTVFLFSDGWFDPDGDALSYSWWLYEDPGRGTLPQATLDQLAATTSTSLLLDLTGVADGSQLHLILEITDDDEAFPLTRYERFIINVGEFIALQGDYNASGQVEQGDLDLVLQNWGIDSTGNVPAGWANDLPAGVIDQGELDGVLQNWGTTAAPDFSGATVPEPALASLGLLLVGLGVRRRCR